MPRILFFSLLLAALCRPAAAHGANSTEGSPASPATPEAQGRADENAVRQALDAFGTSVGRETIGLYNASSVRGFSPIAAGNARIDGLYFDQVWAPGPRMRRSANIRVGISAQGYLFPAPTGIVDYSLRKPGASPKLSVQVGADSFGAAHAETDAELPLGPQLSLGLGGTVSNTAYPNGTDARYRNAALALRWTPTTALEFTSFWHRSEGYDDEEGPVYIPAGSVLPPRIARRRFNGPAWADYRGSAINYGGLAALRPGGGWTLQAGLFRSMYDDQQSFSHLLTDVRPDGAAHRIIIADPPVKTASTSGELRLSHEVSTGTLHHSLHGSLRGRDRARRYDGSQRLDLGPTTIGQPFPYPAPVFAFSAQTRDRTRQWTGGLAYELRWPQLGEFGLSAQKTRYRKLLHQPGLPAAHADDAPWLPSLSAAVHVAPSVTAYGSYTRGLEESGAAPDSAANRNELLPAIQTSQGDLGIRYAVTPAIRLVAGVFDLRKPYFNFDAAKRYVLLGDVRHRGVELSLAGDVAPRLSMVAGAMLSRPRATGEGVRLGRIGPRPVGLTNRSMELSLDWRTPWAEGLSVDVTANYTGRVTATVDNQVSVPARKLVNLGGRYRLQLGGRPATLRVVVNNLFDAYGLDLRGAGVYDIIPGRLASAYLSVGW